MILIVFMLMITGCIYVLLSYFGAKFFDIQEVRLVPGLRQTNSPDLAAALQSDPKAPKTFDPLSTKFKDQENRLPFSIGGIRKKLLKAGSPMGVLEFLAFKALAMTIIPVVAFMFLAKNFPPEMLLLSSLFIGFFLPEIWLGKQIKKRQASIMRDLPNIIDLLNLCVSGGLDFMLAVNRVVKDLKPCDLTRELGEVYRDTQMGKTRREALKNFASRVDMPEVHSFVRTLVQADRMGSPMGEALNLQSEEMRVRRFQHGESMALKAPIKLLFPLFAFILPVVMIIVGGPIIMQFVGGGMKLAF